MSRLLMSATLPLLRRTDPERAHKIALLGLRLGLAGRDTVADDPVLSISALGIDFTNPIGLAAGFDKDAIALAGLSRLGFGHIETGTVTPRPQAGNPRPRLFRLDEDDALVNRMGFNNRGIDAYLKRFAGRPRAGVPVGSNVGINKDAAEPESDYASLVGAVSLHADYVVLNVSSPNTIGLRALQAADRLSSVLRAVKSSAQRTPLLVKVSPDLSEDELEAIVNTCISCGVHGLILTNSTVSRPASLRSRHRGETGGLSGRPLFEVSTKLLAQAYRMARGRLVLVGVGGVKTGNDALAKIEAGASLVQVYSGFVFAGPALVRHLKNDLTLALRNKGFNRICDAVGSDAERWANSAASA